VRRPVLKRLLVGAAALALTLVPAAANAGSIEMLNPNASVPVADGSTVSIYADGTVARTWGTTSVSLVKGIPGHETETAVTIEPGDSPGSAWILSGTTGRLQRCAPTAPTTPNCGPSVG
jgi:hypothetical protein